MEPLENGLRKVSFALTRDEEGYPPGDTEGLWAIPTDMPEEYILDNIPFFVENIALGDLIEVSDDNDGRLWFSRIIEDGGHSTLWAFVEDLQTMETLRSTLHGLGLRSEADAKRGMVALDLPPDVDYASVAQYLDKGEKQGRWEYAEGAVRHSAST